MYLILKKVYIIHILCLSLFTLNSFAQSTENVLILTKQSNQKKIKQIDPDSYFKLKTIDGEKLKGKFDSVYDNYFVSAENDTIFLNDICWIKAKKQLTKLEKSLAIAGVFAGIYFSLATIPAAFMIIESNALIILAPIASISATVGGFRILGGRRYKMKRWKLDTQRILN